MPPLDFSNLSSEYAVWAALAAWRLTHLFLDEAGPFNILVHFRSVFGIRHDPEGAPVMYPGNVFATGLSCFWCLSFWMMLICMGAILINPALVLPFSIWALIIIIQRLLFDGPN
jgi:hypothetical protein